MTAKTKMSVIAILLVVSVAMSMAAPPIYPIVDSPETRLWNSLDKAEQMEVLRMAFGSTKHGPLHSPALQMASFGNTRNDKLNSPDVQHLAKEILRYTSRSWELTPDQMGEIQETGRLCNDKGECIDFGGSWGHGCCPFG